MDTELQGPDDEQNERTELRTQTVVKVVKSKSSVNDWRGLKMADGSFWAGMVGDDVTEGVELTAEGFLKYERGEGTFNIKNVINIVGDYSSEIQWLATEFKDIGPKRAKAIQKQYATKEELRDMLFNRPEELAQISGITEKRAQEIGRHYQEHKEKLDMTFELVTMGLKPYSLAKKVLKHFGADEYNNDGSLRGNLLNRIAEDPYILYDVSGVSFAKCDEVAEKLGLRETDARRFRCWLRDQLEIARGGGERKNMHVEGLTQGDCLALGSYIHEAQKNSFKYSLRQIGNAIQQSDHLVFTPTVVSPRDFPKLEVNKGDEIMGGVMLADLDDSERRVALKALELGNRPNVQLPFTPDMSAGGKNLDDSQKQAVLGLVSHGFAAMTGGPGTGKTTTLKTALAAFTQAGMNVKLAAFTGKAAKRMTQAIGMKATTIHRLLEWSPEGWQRDSANPIEADVVVLDESSMIDITIAEALFEAIGYSTRLLFVGDADQLPPVGPGQPFFDILASGKVPKYVLTKTHRQAEGSWVIDNARRIIHGEMPELNNTWDFNFVNASNSDSIVNYVIKAYQDAKLNGYESELQVLAAVKDSGAGVRRLNWEVQAAINPNAREHNPHVNMGKPGKKGEKKYQGFVGDKVIYTKNDRDLGLVNGDTGEIVDIKLGKYADGHIVYVRFDGFEDSEEHPDGVFELQGEKYMPLELAYALTVHKSQGSEWARVIVVADEAHMFLKRQLFYTAITRTSKYLTIIGTRNAVQRAVNSEPDTQRATRLIERLLGLM